MMNQSRWLPVLLVVLVVTAGLVGAFVGRRATLAALDENVESAFSLRREVQQLRAQELERQGELELLRTRNAVDRQALEIVRSEIAGHKEREAELEEGLRFYRSLMAPGAQVQGISLRAPELIATDHPRQYRFRVVVQQEARKHELVQGKLALQVIGQRAGLEVSYPLQELSETLTDATTDLKFRYFQTLEGEFTLPEGVEPVAVAATAQTSKPRKTEVSQRFPWQLQKRFTHVGE
ncbi:MAG: hypothetical protein Hals2KO_29620 [Halioglobus sp.]